MPLLSTITGGAWQYITPIVTSGLVQYLDAATYISGGTWPAYVGGSAALTNAPTKQSGNGGYFSFNGSNQSATISSGTVPSMLSWSLECWMQLPVDITKDYTALVTEEYTGTTNAVNFGFTHQIGWGTTALASSIFSGAAWYHTPNTGYSFTKNIWYHMVGYYNGSTLGLYVNGVSVSTLSISLAGGTAGNNIYIAKRWDTGLGDYLACNVAIIRIYNRALSGAEIAQNFNAERTRFGI